MHKEYADIEWSKKLGHLFPKAEYWFRHDELNGWFISILKPDSCFTKQMFPAITINMALERLPEYTKLKKYKEGYVVGVTSKEFKQLESQSDKKAVNALCSMLYYLDKQGMIKEEK